MNSAWDISQLFVKESLSRSPCEERIEFLGGWVTRFFDQLDANITNDEKLKLMNGNGRACHRAGLQGTPPKKMNLDQLIEELQRRQGPDNCIRDGNDIVFSYRETFADANGTKGHCLCPIAESMPKHLSGTFCLCSVGYVQDIFESATDKKFRVELLESLIRGGKGCRFKISPA